LLAGQLCAGFLEHRAAPGKQFRVVALPHVEVRTAIQHGQRPFPDVRVEPAEL